MFVCLFVCLFVCFFVVKFIKYLTIINIFHFAFFFSFHSGAPPAKIRSKCVCCAARGALQLGASRARIRAIHCNWTKIGITYS